MVQVCASNDTSFTSDGTVNTFRVMFKEPVEVLPNTNYTAYATLKVTFSWSLILVPDLVDTEFS